MTPALLPAQGRQRDGLRRSDPPAPLPPGQPSGGAAHGPALPPRPARLACQQRAAPGTQGCPRAPTERVHPGGDAPATEGGQGRRPRTAPPRGGRWGATARPPPVPPPPHRPASHEGAGPPTPRGGGDDPLSPRQGRSAREGGRSRARLHTPAACSRRSRDGQANPR